MATLLETARAPLSEPVILPTGATPRMPGIPPLSAGARWVFLVLAVLFAMGVETRFNGSSIGCMTMTSSHAPDIHIKDAEPGLVLSYPKIVRSDEWLVWTPSILSQALQNPSFPTSNPSLGPGKTPLLMSIPARHYTMLLRPQLWGYFLLPFEYAFAWNWTFKICALFGAMFLLFWMLTQGRLDLSLFGALTVLFSPLVQWWFSSPSMLPEMLAYWALGVVACVALFVPRIRRAWRLGAVLLLAICLDNLVLFCYPPFGIVLFDLGAVLVAGFLWQHGLFSKSGALLTAGAFALAVAVLIPWFNDCYATLQIVAHTIYPGQRRCFGGGLDVLRLFSGVFALDLTEKNCPGALGNVCEAANFYPVWLIPLTFGAVSFVGIVTRRSESTYEWVRARAMKALICGYLLVLALFTLVPFPGWLCQATLLSRTTEGRTLVGIGIAGTTLLLLCMADRENPRTGWRGRALAGLVWTAGVLALLFAGRHLVSGPAPVTPYLTTARFAFLAGTGAAFGFIYLLAPLRWVQVALVSPFILSTALVNPVCFGLPELLESPALNAVRHMVRSEPDSKWVVYDSIFGIELIKACGAPLINGVHIIPDPAIIRRLDPENKHAFVFNRYGHLIFMHDNPSADDLTVQLKGKISCGVQINPAQLRAVFPEVRFIAAPLAIPELASQGFKLVGCSPADLLWVYHLEGNQPPTLGVKAPAAPAPPPPGGPSS